MPVQKTESRLPAGFTASDLGQSNSSGAIHLISYLSSPLVKLRIQTYCVFVTNAAAVATYSWTINDNGTTSNQITNIGFLEFTPQNPGTLSVSVELKDGSAASIGTVALTQTVVALNTALEVLIDQQDTNIPAAGHPATSREAVNDLRMYVDAMLPPASDALFNKLVLSIGYTASLLTPQLVRNALSANYAAAINSNPSADLSDALEKGIGICKVRPQVLAMFLNNPATSATYIPFAELPTAPAAYKTAFESIKTNFNGLSQDIKTDLFNLLRFPKSNYKMVKLIVEKLKDKYFSSTAISQILGDKNNASKLIVQYFLGPFTGAGTTSKMGAAVFDIMQQPVWGIAALPLAGASPAASSGGNAAAVFASPEQIPQLTYIAKARDNDNGYIRSAVLYHSSFGLNPLEFDSIEELVTKLSKDSSHISRLRIVSHFFNDPTGKELSSMYIPFFKPAQTLADEDPYRFTVKDYFKFGVNKDAGLAVIAGRNIETLSHITNVVQIDIDANNMGPLTRVILDKLRSGSPNTLVPFSLQGATSKPSGLINEFFLYCCDLYYINHTDGVFEDDSDPNSTPLNMSATVKSAIVNILNTRMGEAAQALVAKGQVAAKLDDLRNAIAAIPISSFFGSPTSFTSQYSQQLPQVFTIDHPNFLIDLGKVRGRFDSSSVIDMRGCNIGNDSTFLLALKEFFGKPGSLPIVTGPDWYQNFTGIAYNYTNQEAGIDLYYKSGVSPFSSTDVQRDYSTWAGRIGLPSQLSFWAQLVNGDAFNFLTFQWKSNLPGLALPAVKLNGFSALSFSAALQRIGEIFNIAASLPAAPQVTTFETNILPQLATLKTLMDQVSGMTASTPAGDLNAANTTLQQVATALSQNIAPVANPVTLAYLTTSIDKLKLYVTQQLDVAPFMAALKAKLAADTAGIRYLAFIGLPLQVQNAANEKDVSLFMLQSLRDDALKTWFKSQWGGTIPGASAIDALVLDWTEASHEIKTGPKASDYDFTSLGKALQFAGLASDHNNKEAANSPTYEYQQHIKSTN